MNGRLDSMRARPAALIAVICFAAGCATISTRAGRSAAMRTPGPIPQAAPVLPDFDAAEQRHAEALAYYAAGVSLEWRLGFDAALPEYRRSLELDPQHSALAVRLSQYYLSRKDNTNAVAILEFTIKANPSGDDAWYWLGRTQQITDQTQKAVAAYKQALKINPANLDAMRALVDLSLQQNSPAEIVAVLDRAFQPPARSGTNDASYWLQLGDIWNAVLRQKPSLSHQISRDKIRQAYEKAASISPNDPDVLIRLADVYTDAGETERAAEIYAKLLRMRPEMPQVRERLALAYLRGNDREKAAAALEEIIKREPLRHDIYNYLGELYEEIGNDEKAISNYQQSLVLEANQLPPSLRIALLQMKAKKYDNALETLAHAREKFTSSWLISYYSALVYNDKKEYSKAVAAFEDAERLAEETSTAQTGPKLDGSFYFYYGAACERAGEHEQAAKFFRKSIELEPEKDAAYNYLGFMWADKGIHLQEAYDLIQKAVELAPDTGAYIDSLGWVLYKMGRYEEALPQLRRAAELVKDDATVFDHLGDVLFKLGKRDEAIVQWRRAHEIEPENKEIAEKLEQYSPDHTAAPVPRIAPQSPAP
jgi:tetratricopeptide (TPR) repeat protein